MRITDRILSRLGMFSYLREKRKIFKSFTQERLISNYYLPVQMPEEARLIYTCGSILKLNKQYAEDLKVNEV